MKEERAIFGVIEERLKGEGFRFERTDFDRPWGGFFVIDEQQALEFIGIYFPDVEASLLINQGRVSPKILIVLPNKRLSWQYHHRRSEVWRSIEGDVGVIRSDTDKEGALQHLAVGEELTLFQGERHRLVGLDEIGIVAEIWQHTNPDFPSDEDDIVRLQDDFGR